MAWSTRWRRLTTALSMMAREFLRKRGTLIMIVIVPLVGLVATYAALPPAPATVDGIENGVRVRLDIDQRDLFGVFQGLTWITFLAGVTGLNLMQSGLKADRRLVLAGYAPSELAGARILLLMLVNIPLTLYVVALMLVFTLPRHLPAYTLALFWSAVVYSLYGALTGAVLRHEWGGILVMLFLANIDAGYLQVPGFSNILDEWYARLLPAYFPAQLAVDAAFTSNLEQLGPAWWTGVHSLVIAGVMLMAYQRATHIHKFLPEKQPHPIRRAIVAISASLLVAVGAWYGVVYYRSLPPVVEADGRIGAPEARVVSILNGRLTELYVAEGQDVAAGDVVAWVEDPVAQIALPLRAPLGGHVTKVPVRHDENVIQGDVVAVIHQLSKLEAVLEVEETAIANVQVGQRVELRLGSTGVVVRGLVREIAHEPLPPEGGVSERARKIRKYGVKVTLPDPDDRLALDMGVHGRIFY